MRQEPHSAGCRTLATFGIRWRVVEIAIDVENMNIFRSEIHECLSRSDHDTAIAADQQRNVSRLLQIGRDTLADAVPGDPWARPTPDRRDRVVGKIAGNRDVAVIDRFTAGCFEAREQMSIAISLSVVFIARVQRAGPQRDSQDMIGPLGLMGML